MKTMKPEIKILRNALINSELNLLIPVDIYFTDKIIMIEKLSDKEIKWNNIENTKSKLHEINSLKILERKFKQNEIDCNFNLVIPGAIDPHVHFDTPGFEFRDTFEQGSIAAAYGGVTTVIDMPCTSLPPVTSFNNFQTKINIVKNRSLIDFAFWGGVSGNNFNNQEDIKNNIIELNEAGVAGFKVYLISGMDTFKDLSLKQIDTIAKFITPTNKPMGVHSEDKNLIESKMINSIINNKNSWKDYCSARDSIAEAKAVKEMIKISHENDLRVHIVHLSSELGLNAIAKAQQDGIKISAETCPHYLYFTQKDFENVKIRNYLKTAPPVKGGNDKKALWNGLKNGVLNFVTTDHAGCNPSEEKITDNFWEVYGGIPGVEHRVPFLFSEGFLKNRLTLSETINLLSSNVADYFNISSKGKIKTGYDADFAIINLWDSEIVKSENMHSKGKYTPFEGIKFNVKVEKTILRGKIIMDRENEVEEKIGYGKFIEIRT